MSSFLEGLVRRGAGLGAAPGEQTAALRPLSRFELRPFDAIDAEPAAPAEFDSFVPATARQPTGRDTGPDRERDKGAHPPAAPTGPPNDDAPSSLEPMAARDNPTWIEAVVGGPQDIGGPPGESRPTAAAKPIESPRMSAHEHAAPMPVPEASHPIDPPIESESSAVHDSTQADEWPPVVAQPPGVDARVGPPLPMTNPLPVSIPPDLTIRVRHAATNAPADRADGQPATPSSQRAPIEHESPGEPAAPQLTIAIGRIEIDFGQRPAAPPPAPGPQRTRGFEAYARARRGNLR